MMFKTFLCVGYYCMWRGSNEPNLIGAKHQSSLATEHYVKNIVLPGLIKSLVPQYKTQIKEN